MINFHKFGFLDTKKLQRYVENANFWICRFNPIWLFIWSDYYKPEIAYDNEFCFIRFLMPQIGMCYYPPLGNGSLEKGLKIIKEDCRENGFDFYISPIDERMVNAFIDLKYEIKENNGFESYIYSLEDVAFFKKNKAKKNLLKKFEHNHKNAYYRPIKKEDFPAILEFIELWRTTTNMLKDNMYYAKLNSIKRLMEHLYEYELLGIMLCEEEKIYGVIVGSIIGNMAYVHLNLTLDEPVGSKEELLICFAKVALLKARFLNLEEDLEIEAMKKELMEYKPLKLEKFYSTFRL